MYARVRSSVLTTIAVGALVAAAPPARPELPPPIHRDVALTAAPALGAIPLAFLRNQGQYCSLICPYVVQGVVTVPLGVLQAPGAFLDALSAGTLTQALGAAAVSITQPANAAAEGIILNDVDHVVPKAFNNLEVAVVQLTDVGAAILTPARLPATISTARQTILDALNQQLPPPAPTVTGARTLPQVVVVEAIKVSAAVAFEAGELGLLGIVQTADAGAQELARSGDPAAAVTAAAGEAGKVVRQASSIVTDSVDTAVKNVAAAVRDPFGKPAATSTLPAPLAKVRDEKPVGSRHAVPSKPKFVSPFATQKSTDTGKALPGKHFGLKPRPSRHHK